MNCDESYGCLLRNLLRGPRAASSITRRIGFSTHIPEEEEQEEEKKEEEQEEEKEEEEQEEE